MLGELKELKEMQAKAEMIKKRLDSVTVKGMSTDNKIQVMCSGNKKVQNIIIDDSLLNKESKDHLQTSITEATNDAFKQAENVMER